MKPTKNKKKNVIGESGSSIPDYFKSAPKEPFEPTSFNIKSVYVNALVDKLKSFDKESDSTTSSENHSQQGNDGGTVAPATILATKLCDGNNTIQCDGCEAWRLKYEALRKLYVTLSLRHSDILMKHDELLKTKTGAVTPTAEEGADGIPETPSGVFSANEIRCLQSLPLDKKKDSTFILQCIKYAYKNDTANLCKKTLKGTLGRIEIDDGVKTVHPAKDPSSPEKVKRIEQLFIDRVSKSKCLAAEFGERVKPTYINKLIASAIKNVANKEKPKDKASTANADLNL